MNETFLKAYENIIQPVNGMDLWERTYFPKILPPVYNRQSGRPPKVRREEAGEKETKTDGKKLRRYEASLKYGTCGQKGHNSVTCHRHKPPNERNQHGKKKKTKSAVGSSIPTSEPDNYDVEMGRKNQMREKAKQRAQVLKEKIDKKKAENAATSTVDSNNPTGARKMTKRSNTKCSNYASVQESQTGVQDQLGFCMDRQYWKVFWPICFVWTDCIGRCIGSIRVLYGQTYVVVG
ncbi:hypothetical protein L3X38_002837 [Prunus dulcis]|uniref:Uncharacterized protein n=1 Tax=Prunus dulcis TaxID=3755 RepID=A0AAD4WV87_PRUDU|nr:hypothetical protein L3X38_002837 [Prunus dulcis]